MRKTKQKYLASIVIILVSFVFCAFSVHQRRPFLLPRFDARIKMADGTVVTGQCV